MTIFLDSLQKLIAQTMVRWGEETFLSDQNLVREMFSLLHRQYNGVAEVSGVSVFLYNFEIMFLIACLVNYFV